MTPQHVYREVKLTDEHKHHFGRWNSILADGGIADRTIARRGRNKDDANKHRLQHTARRHTYVVPTLAASLQHKLALKRWMEGIAALTFPEPPLTGTLTCKEVVRAATLQHKPHRSSRGARARHHPAPNSLFPQRRPFLHLLSNYYLPCPRSLSTHLPHLHDNHPPPVLAKKT